MITNWPASYVGIAFADYGVTRAGLNCWGLVRLVLHEQCGIVVPAYPIPASELRQAAREFRASVAGEPWIEIGRANASMFDCVLMAGRTSDNLHRVPGHVGIMIDRDRVLHIERGTNATHVRLDHHSVRSRIIGFYRHKDLGLSAA